MQKHQKIKAV